VRCACCEQKVRYLAAKAGDLARCPRCRQPVVLPATPQPLARPRLPYRVGERLLPRAG
jgi:DNA-directed RNA polymerase subunit RPC12/RpoP